MSTSNYQNLKVSFSEKLLSNKETLINTINSYDMLDQNVKDLLTQIKSLEPVVRKLKDTSRFNQAEQIFEKEVTLVDKLKEMIKLDPTALLHHKDSFLQFKKKARNKMKKSGALNNGPMSSSGIRSSSCTSNFTLFLNFSDS